MTQTMKELVTGLQRWDDYLPGTSTIHLAAFYIALRGSGLLTKCQLKTVINAGGELAVRYIEDKDLEDEQDA